MIFVYTLFEQCFIKQATFQHQEVPNTHSVLNEEPNFIPGDKNSPRENMLSSDGGTSFGTDEKNSDSHVEEVHIISLQDQLQ